MNLFILKKTSVEQLINLVQILLLFSYLTLNIANVGEGGGGLPLLASFLILATAVLFLQITQNLILLRLHFFIFLMLLQWILIRGLLDLQSLEYLKQITIATTGGILLFFLIGTLSRRAIDSLINLSNSTISAKILLIYFCLISIFIFQEYSSRLVRTDIFYIDDVDGSYQRPGNFFIMLFIIISFIYLKMISHAVVKKRFTFVFWFFIYSFGLVIALISSQMIGSNAATANLVAIYLITSVISFLSFNKKIRKAFLDNHLSLPFSKKIIKKIFQYAFLSLIGLSLVISLFIQFSDFDLSTTRAFGFGDGANSSLNSRMDILKHTGAAQMGYSPIFGNLNVAYLTTGNASKFLHNFIPNIIAELGLIGLLIVITLFFLVFKILIVNFRVALFDEQNFQHGILNLWVCFILLYFLLYANIAVGKEWPVIWFFIGFSVSVFAIKKKMF